MATSIHNLIAAINPDLYCDSSVKSEVKKLAKEDGYLKAADKAKPVDVAYMDLIDIQYKSATSAPGLKAPVEKHTLIYENMSEGLEHVYFWLLDKLNDIGFKKTEKLVDNFVASPGSGHFSEMGGKLSKMQDEAGKWLGASNNLVKSILNIIYDLKEFEVRLQLYDNYTKAKGPEKEAALISLKQVWLDTVDVKRGNTGLKALAFSQQGAFVTLIDGFMAIEDESLKMQGKEIDLNDRVKHLLKQKITEFRIWLKESERELRKRYEIEKTYLKSQVNIAQLYARWAKPYLRAARALSQSQSLESAAVVNAFNTAVFELTVLAESSYDPTDDVFKGELPALVKKEKRKYNAIIILEFKFRTVPERAQQGYGFRGKTEVTFTSYALNTDELALLRKEIAQDDMNDVLSLIEGATTESLETLRQDITTFLGDDTFAGKKEEKKKEKQTSNDPLQKIFDDLTDFFSFTKKESKIVSSEKDKGLKKDSSVEKLLRSQAIIDARKRCYLLYDLYKKAHKMSSLPGHA